MNDFSDLTRFTSKFSVNEATGCWEWSGARDRGGYGRFTFRGRLHAAHRVAYELFVGPIPEGLDIDHLCRVRNCVNTEHLEPVTTRENIVRGLAPALAGLRMASKTHCPRGHEYTEANTYIAPTGGRLCRTCNRDRRHPRKAA